MDELGHAPERVPPAERALGRYQLAYELASGGMATVFLGRAVDPGGVSKLVAIKRIHKHLARSREFVDMFLDEARIVARITHPNVCSVFELGEVDGTYFIAMEYLAGETLGGLVRALERSELSVSERAAVVVHALSQACEGLHAAHELRGPDGEPLEVVHRDVSPSNLFVTYDGAVKVVDFGIARARNRVTRTEAGTVKGKFGYFAPEQIGGVGTHDRRGDVWAMGVVAWEALVGRRLFRRESELETAFAIAHEDIVPPSVARPGVPQVLDAPVLAALTRDPANRTPTARAFGRALTHALAQAQPAFGSADLAELMDRLYPEAHALALRLAESAVADSTPDAPVAAPGLGASAPPKRGSEEPTAVLGERAGGGRVRRTAGWWVPLGLMALVVTLGAIIVASSGEWAPTPIPATPPALASIDAGGPTDAPELPDAVAERDAPLETPDAAAASRPSRPEARSGSTSSPDASSPAPPPVAVATPPPGRGSLSVIARGAPGFAEVWIDGERAGYAPLQRSLPAGPHEIEVRTSTGESRRASVVVEDDEIERVVARFDAP